MTTQARVPGNLAIHAGIKRAGQMAGAIMNGADAKTITSGASDGERAPRLHPDEQLQ